MVDKPFLTIDQQINLLKNRNLIIQNEQEAKRNLLSYGYYEIINGYKDPFLDDNSNNEKFKDGITFEHIFNLFSCDRYLRTWTMSSLEIFESNLRQAVAYTIAEDFSYNQNEYLSRRNYRVGRRQYSRSTGREAYPVDILLNILRRITQSNSQPFKHYREDHHNIPPWIIVKKLNFGNLIWWFRLLKNPQKKKVISILTGIDIVIIKQISGLETGVANLLSLYLSYRNTAAHGGRIYNHFSNEHKLAYNDSIHGLLQISPADYRNGKGQSRFGVLANSLNLFQDKMAYNQLRIGTEVSLKQYLKAYPEYKSYLLNTMELTEDYINFSQTIGQHNSSDPEDVKS